jgi:UDP-2,3-diacylglucosamine pyrophosphatase LpxH
MIIIADAHIDVDRGVESGFFQMLQVIEKTDQDVIFLGDIFDLWVALPRYEEEIHKLFLSWCRGQKNRRSVGFIEGNHEYFVADEKKDHFTWCSDAASWKDDKGNLFCHGDQINRCDKNYLRFRKCTKNKIGKTIVRFFPFGPRFVPEDMIAEYAEGEFKDGAKMIFVAHFHQDYIYRNPESKALYVLPGWFKTKQITLYDMESEQVNSLHWRDIPLN